MRLYVWFEPVPITEGAASEKVMAYLDDDMSPFQPHPSLFELYDDVLTRFPVDPLTTPPPRGKVGGIWEEIPQRSDRILDFVLGSDLRTVDVMFMIVNFAAANSLACYNDETDSLLEGEG